MKVLLVSSSDTYGAGIAARRLHDGFRRIGLESVILVQEKKTDIPEIVGPKTKFEKLASQLKPVADAIPLYVYPDRLNSTFSTSWIANRKLQTIIKETDPDIINLHWICRGFLAIEDMKKFEKPIVWTLHDMWPFTGGCHYALNCEKYQDSCGNCPQLESMSNLDLSKLIWKRKKDSWNELPMTIVTPSTWLAECAKKSSLMKNYRIETIHNGVDTNRFQRIDKTVARSILGLPRDKSIILFGAANLNDERKGFKVLVDSLKILSESKRELFGNTALVVFGSSETNSLHCFEDNTIFLGHLYDDFSLSIAYSSADVFVAPSIQDNLPNTLIESNACGTPCVAFDVGGINNIITHKENGYLCAPGDPKDLAAGIAWVIEHKDLHVVLSDNSKRRAQTLFHLETQAHQYFSLFRNILDA